MYFLESGKETFIKVVGRGTCVQTESALNDPWTKFPG